MYHIYMFSGRSEDRSIFGTKYKSKAELAGGIILILIGVKVVLDGLGIL